MDEATLIATIAAVVLGAFLLAGVWIAARPGGEFAGHPKGLFVLFFAEMWERFSYYGMRALLIFYLTKHWLFSDGQANLVYGAYTSLVYITPVLGGYIADRWLGQRKAVLFGAILLTCGHFLMAFEGIIQHDAAGATAIAFVGVILLVMALVSFAQPVKMLPILLIVAGIAFILLALWWAEGDLLNNDYRMITGVFWTLVAVIAVYMAAAISLLVVKGKPVLPLLIKA